MLGLNRKRNRSLLIVPLLRLCKPLLLKLLHNIVVSPANLAGKLTKVGNLTLSANMKNLKGRRDNHLLHLIIRGGAAIENVEALKGGCTTGVLVREHPTDGTPEHERGGLVVERTTAGVGVRLLGNEAVESHFIAAKGAGDDGLLGTNTANVLAEQELLGDDGGETTLKVALAINNDFLH